MTALKDKNPLYEYVGALHIHSVFSDGSGTVPDIARLAGESGLDFIVLTDHNTLRARTEGYERFHDSTFVLVGYEINDKENRNHYLALGVNETFSTRMQAAEYVRKINSKGGFGFIAHPHEKRNSMKDHPAYPWTAWDCDEYTGIEIWNHMSEWMENLTEQNKYESFLHPLKTIVAPQSETLALWDELNTRRRVPAIAGIDAHAHKVNVFGFVEVEVFPYKVLFKSLRTHILLGLKFRFSNGAENIAQTSKAILESLSSGCSFIANDNVHNSYGFRFFASSGEDQYQMGETVQLTKELYLNTHCPASSVTVKYIRNGRVVSVSESADSQLHCTEPGAYRIEVKYHNKAWIYANHIRVEQVS